MEVGRLGGFKDFLSTVLGFKIRWNRGEGRNKKKRDFFFSKNNIRGGFLCPLALPPERRRKAGKCIDTIGVEAQIKMLEYKPRSVVRMLPQFPLPLASSIHFYTGRLNFLPCSTLKEKRVVNKTF